MDGLFKAIFQLSWPRTISFKMEMKFSSPSIIIFWDLGGWEGEVIMSLGVGFDEKGRQTWRRGFMAQEWSRV